MDKNESVIGDLETFEEKEDHVKILTISKRKMMGLRRFSDDRSYLTEHYQKVIFKRIGSQLFAVLS